MDETSPKKSNPFQWVVPVALGAGTVILLVVFWKSFYVQLEDYERGVVLELGSFRGKILDPGAHLRLPYPFQSIHKVNVVKDRKLQIGFRVNKDGKKEHIEREALTLTRFGNLVDLEMEVNYVISNPAEYVLKMEDPDLAVEQAAESAMRTVVGLYTIDGVLTEKKRVIVGEIKTLLQKVLDRYQTGITVSRVQFVKAVNPAKVIAAFENVENAKQDSGKSFLDAQRYAKEKLPLAGGQAQRQIEEAKGYAQSVISEARGDSARFSLVLEKYLKYKEVTRRRLYLETLEEVLPKVKKIIVDDESKTTHLLPLGKL